MDAYYDFDTFVSIPFDQGNVFRQMAKINIDATASQSLSIRAMSFDTTQAFKSFLEESLNPFRSGQCLSTNVQGISMTIAKESQSLSIRAMSFDAFY